MGKVLSALAAAPRRVSMEVVPPPRGGDTGGIMACMEAVAPYEPAFVSVTDHPSGRAWAERDGAPISVPIRGKPGTLGLCVAIRDHSGIPVVPHVVCVGNDRFKAEDQLIDIHYAGFSDVFLVKGDERFTPFADKSGDRAMSKALDLIRIAAAMNRGEYLSDGSKGAQAGLSIGVAAYPYKHPSAPNPEADIESLALKVEAGAEWIATQMVFDAERFAGFVSMARAAGIDAPIIPGVKPLTKASSLRSVPGTFFVDVPTGLTKALLDARSPAEERLAGVKFAAGLVQALYDAGAPCVHFFTMGRAKDTVEVLEAVFGKRSGGSPRAGAASGGSK